MENLTVEIPPDAICIKEASCPAGHSLMDAEHPMGGAPSIKVALETLGGQEGDLHLNPWYGNFEVDCSIALNDGEVYDVFCPACRAPLRSPEDKCAFCGARMFQLSLPKGGIVEACTRKGCHNHRLKLVDLSAQLARLFDFDTRPRY